MGGRKSETNRESNVEIYTLPYVKIENPWEFALCLRELSLGLCNNLEAGWDGVGGGREVQEEGDTCKPIGSWLIHIDVQQKPTQYYKAIIFQNK